MIPDVASFVQQLDPDTVSAAFGGGLAGLLAVIIVIVSGTLWLTINGRLKDCKDANGELKLEKTTLVSKIDLLTGAVDRQTTVIEGLTRELRDSNGRRGRA